MHRRKSGAHAAISTEDRPAMRNEGSARSSQTTSKTVVESMRSIKATGPLSPNRPKQMRRVNDGAQTKCSSGLDNKRGHCSGRPPLKGQTHSLRQNRRRSVETTQRSSRSAGTMRLTGGDAINFCAAEIEEVWMRHCEEDEGCSDAVDLHGSARSFMINLLERPFHKKVEQDKPSQPTKSSMRMPQVIRSLQERRPRRKGQSVHQPTQASQAQAAPKQEKPKVKPKSTHRVKFGPAHQEMHTDPKRQTARARRMPEEDQNEINAMSFSTLATDTTEQSLQSRSSHSNSQEGKAGTTEKRPTMLTINHDLSQQSVEPSPAPPLSPRSILRSPGKYQEAKQVGTSPESPPATLPAKQEPSQQSMAPKQGEQLSSSQRNMPTLNPRKQKIEGKPVGTPQKRLAPKQGEQLSSSQHSTPTLSPRKQNVEGKPVGTPQKRLAPKQVEQLSSSQRNMPTLSPRKQNVEGKPVRTPQKRQAPKQGEQLSSSQRNMPTLSPRKQNVEGKPVRTPQKRQAPRQGEQLSSSQRNKLTLSPRKQNMEGKPIGTPQKRPTMLAANQDHSQQGSHHKVPLSSSQRCMPGPDSHGKQHEAKQIGTPQKRSTMRSASFSERSVVPKNGQSLSPFQRPSPHGKHNEGKLTETPKQRPTMLPTNQDLSQQSNGSHPRQAHSSSQRCMPSPDSHGEHSEGKKIGTPQKRPTLLSVNEGASQPSLNSSSRHQASVCGHPGSSNLEPAPPSQSQHPQLPLSKPGTDRQPKTQQQLKKQQMLSPRRRRTADATKMYVKSPKGGEKPPRQGYPSNRKNRASSMPALSHPSPLEQRQDQYQNQQKPDPRPQTKQLPKKMKDEGQHYQATTTVATSTETNKQDSPEGAQDKSEDLSASVRRRRTILPQETMEMLAEDTIPVVALTSLG